MKKIVILLSTYNGENYLEEQISSLARQVDVDIEIYVRDDGSKDNTLNILDKLGRNGILTWYKGDNLGPALSFMDLVKKAPTADYYAFCDQDDIWDDDKLKVAVDYIKNFDDKHPALYFSNTRLVDKDLNHIKIKTQKPRITLGSALIINPVTGCTLVINRKLLEIIRIFDNRNLGMHDGWIYRVCMALDGSVYFDYDPHISYRQHSNNVIGGKSSLFKKYKRRFRYVVSDRQRIRETAAIQLLNGYADLISSDNLEQIKKVANYRKSFLQKFDLILDKRFRTNSIVYNTSFVIAVLLDAF